MVARWNRARVCSVAIWECVQAVCLSVRVLLWVPLYACLYSTALAVFLVIPAILAREHKLTFCGRRAARDRPLAGRPREAAACPMRLVGA